MQMMRLVVDHTTAVPGDEDGDTPLMVACAKGNIDCAELLLVGRTLS
jgi:ankyrin repeat protein